MIASVFTFPLHLVEEFPRLVVVTRRRRRKQVPKEVVRSLATQSWVVATDQLVEGLDRLKADDLEPARGQLERRPSLAAVLALQLGIVPPFPGRTPMDAQCRARTDVAKAAEQ